MKEKTLEEAAENYENKDQHQRCKLDFIEGAKWMKERMYSEEEVLKLLISCKERFGGSDLDDYVADSKVIKWFEQLKLEI